jgi:hypothetical protein
MLVPEECLREMQRTTVSPVQALPLYPFRNFPRTFLYNQRSRSFQLIQHPPTLYLVNLKMEAECYSETVELRRLENLKKTII